jgi:eukaryotic-like serine/threonine-protein kinase
MSARGFSAPELEDGSAPSPASDVYAMAALGWFCLTGAAPVPAALRRSLASMRPETPPPLAEVLTACLATNPAARPSAAVAAVEVFEAAPAESVALVSVSDPGAEITRRIRAAAAFDSAADQSPSGARRRRRTGLVVGALVMLVVALGAGTAWILGQAPLTAGPVGAHSATTAPPPPAVPPAPAPAVPTPAAGQTPKRQATVPATLPGAAPTVAVAGKGPPGPADVLMGSSSPRVAAAALLQALADSRALAYAARSPAILDLVYAPGASKASVDKANIDTALKNGGTYLGLSFVIRDAAFLDGTSGTARIRATIFTPAYQTGQPDGRKIAHPQETLGPCIFSLSLTPDGWRILTLTTP